MGEFAPHKKGKKSRLILEYTKIRSPGNLLQTYDTLVETAKLNLIAQRSQLAPVKILKDFEFNAGLSLRIAIDTNRRCLKNDKITNGSSNISQTSRRTLMVAVVARTRF